MIYKKAPALTCVVYKVDVQGLEPFQSMAGTGNIVILNLLCDIPNLGIVSNKEVVAIQCNPKFKAVYKILVAKGKPKKVAIIACMRKMIVILSSMVREGVMWDQKMA